MGEIPEEWRWVPIASVLREQKVKASDVAGGKELPVLSLTKDRGLIPQADRFDHRVAVADVSKYRVVRPTWIAYNPMVIWEGAIWGLRGDHSGLVSPVYAIWEVTTADWRFLDFLLRTPMVLAEYERLCSGVVKRRRTLKKDQFSAVAIPVPPLPEQRAIAHVLRTVQRAKEATEQVIAAAQELKKSLMRHVFKHGPVPVTEGEPVDWPTEPLERLVQEDRPIRYGILKPGPDIGHGIPYVKVRDYPNGVVELGSLKRTSIEIANQYKRASLQEGDVLVSIRGTTGRVAVVPRELEGGNITQDTARVSPSDSVDRDFLIQYLRSEDAQDFIASWTRGAAVKGINLRELRQLPVPCPSQSVQRGINDLLGAVDQKTTAEEARRDALATLFDSLLNDLMAARLRVTDSELSA